jgi:hypothetical protein
MALRMRVGDQAVVGVEQRDPSKATLEELQRIGHEPAIGPAISRVIKSAFKPAQV